MGIKSIGTILAGATILYAGFLSFANDLYAGTSMAMVGGIIAILPIWKALRKPTANPMKPSAKGKRKTHLKVVNDRDDHPTYH